MARQSQLPPTDQQVWRSRQQPWTKTPSSCSSEGGDQVLLSADGNVVGIEPVTFDPRAGVVEYAEFLTAAAAQVLTAAGTYPLPVSHPFGPPVVTGTSITVEAMLNQPTRITRMVMDLTRERFIADKIFTNGGGV